MQRIDLLSNASRVEAPFVIVDIGGYTFGGYNGDSQADSSGNIPLSTYPNFIQSLNIVKLNGAINTYTLVLKYGIRPGDDPNLLEKVFSKVKSSRSLKLTYGDASIPGYLYKEEEAIISDIRTNFDFNSSSITYTLSCVSKSLNALSGKFSFSRQVAKPSDVIKNLLYDNQYGLLNIFTGMRDKSLVEQQGLIASDDKTVTIEAKKSVTLFDYLNYLVNCMCMNSENPNSTIGLNKYTLVIEDDITSQFNGIYFRVCKVTNNSELVSANALDTYQIDVGYPSDKNIITGFTIDDNQTYSILYDYSDKIQQSNYVSRIDDEGNIQYIYSPVLTNSSQLMKTTQADKNWWTQVTQYPITATLTMKGLLRESILMTYVRLNVILYGRKHISSGTYIITKQTDTLNASGYRTQLNLVRIKGDNLL